MNHLFPILFDNGFYDSLFIVFYPLALGLDDKTGNLEVGQEFDALHISYMNHLSPILFF